MRPIGLTRKYPSGTVRGFYINPDRITHFQAADDEYETYVWLAGEGVLKVSETPDQIVHLLMVHRDRARAEERDGVTP